MNAITLTLNGSPVTALAAPGTSLRDFLRAQGCFSPRSYQLHFSLEYVAHNLDTPTVVLQYPSERELIRERTLQTARAAG